MKNAIAVVSAILLFLAAAAATLFILKKKGLIEFDAPGLDKPDEDCCCECDEDENIAAVEEHDTYKPEPKKEPETEPEKKKEPVLKSGFSASDFKL